MPLPGPGTKYFFFQKGLFVVEVTFLCGFPEGGDVLDNSRGNTGAIITHNALVVSSKLLLVLIEVGQILCSMGLLK